MATGCVVSDRAGDLVCACNSEHSRAYWWIETKPSYSENGLSSPPDVVLNDAYRPPEKRSELSTVTLITDAATWFISGSVNDWGPEPICTSHE